MKKISILHPSRGRPEKSLQTIKRWFDLPGKPYNIEVIISIDTDDPCKSEYYRLYTNNWPVSNLPISILENKNTCAVDAINYAAKTSVGDIIIVVSDDTDCPDFWYNLLIIETQGKEDFILKCMDGIQKWMITMPVMDRKYYDRFGYVYYPEYRHMFCDTELSCVADLTGRRLTSKLLFPHLHYSTGASKKDFISERADKTWQQGEDLFLSRYKNRFGFNTSPAAITDETTVRWANMKLNNRR